MRYRILAVTSPGRVEFEKLRDPADLIVEATGDEGVLAWLDTAEASGRCQVASVWTNADASIGVGVLSGHGPGLGVAALREHVVRVIKNGEVPGCGWEAYHGPEPIVPGVGCWHPTFAGSWVRLVGLGAALSDWLRRSARANRAGRAVVFAFKNGGWQELRSWSIDLPQKALG